MSGSAGRLSAGWAGRAGAVMATLDARFAGWAVAWTAVAFVGLGLATAMIPNPVVIRLLDAEPFAYVVWLLSAPLAGVLGATYSAPARPSPGAPAAPLGVDQRAASDRGSTLGSVAGIGLVFAVGCPICNKIALLLLGTSGALSVFAPIQPVLGAASLLLLAVTVAWRLDQRPRAAACAS